MKVKMSESKSAGSSGGTGVLGLLGVVFVTLKLCGVIDWSWWWVTAPFWAGPVFLIAAAAFVLLACAATPSVVYIVNAVSWIFGKTKSQ